MRLSFNLVSDTGKTKIWDVYNGTMVLGLVKWYAPWRRYCFCPIDGSLFDVSCLREIINFIDSEMLSRPRSAPTGPKVWIYLPE